MGQTIRLFMPFNANHAFAHALVKAPVLNKHLELWHNYQSTPAQLACERTDR